MIVLYVIDESPFCEKVRRALQYKRLPYEARALSLVEVLTSYRKVNPVGKVPALEVDGRVVADSTDIAHFLDERWPDPPLLPRDPADRALCHFLEDWADESLYYCEMRLRFTFPRNRSRWIDSLLARDAPLLRPLLRPAVARAVRRQCAAQGIGRKPEEAVLRDLERHLDALADWLAGRPWLAGPDLSLADLAVLAQLHCVEGTEEGRARIAARPAVVGWLKRVAEATDAPARPA